MELPVVATDIRGCREAVVDGVTGLLVPAKTTEPLASAIGRVLSDGELANRFARAGRARVVDTFDERFVFERLQRCHEELGVRFS